MRMQILAATAAIALLSAGGANAAVIDWTQWSGTTASPDTGVSGAIGVTYTGDTFGTTYGYPSWTPVGTWSGGTVDNAPLPGEGMIQLVGGNEHVNTITFSSAVLNPVMAIWSLGQCCYTTSFVFDTSAISFEAGGPSAEYGGQPITVVGNTVGGVEGNGVVQFNGTFKSISWTNPTNEYWYGFTVGTPGVAAGVPEPATWAMMLLGFGGLGAALRRRRSALALA